jgi:uncharacterized alpha-E superfamily protein
MLLCRLAENAFWLGRYLERAEDLARALLAYEDIRLDIPGQRAPGWQRLAALAGIAPADGAALEPTSFVDLVILDRYNPSSLLGAFHAARENLRRSRAQFPSDCWHTLNPTYLRLASTDAAAPPAELRARLDGVVACCRELAGHVAAAMLRDETNAFLRLGVHIERGDMMLRVATIVADTLLPAGKGAPFEDVRWMGLLKSVGAYGTYRHRYHAATDFRSALQLLLFEPTFPRSLSYGLSEISRILEGLPRHTEPLGAVQACRPLIPVETRAALDGFARAALLGIARASATIQKSYFFFMDAPPVETNARAHGKRAVGSPPRVRRVARRGTRHADDPKHAKPRA